MSIFDLSILSSGRQAERHRELEAVREWFADTRNGPYATEAQEYLLLYQAMFACVRQDAVPWEKKEKAQNKPKGAVQVNSKLEKCGGALRLVVERTYQHIGMAVLKALLRHLLQASAFQGRLVDPLALDYAKTLNIVFSYAPHRDHLEVTQWTELVLRCFDVLLDDELSRSTPFDDNFEDDDPSEDEDNTRVDLDDDSLEDVKPNRKRGRPQSPPAGRKRASTSSRPLSACQKEYATLLHRLFTTSRCHLLDKVVQNTFADDEETGYRKMKLLQSTIFNKFRRFFSSFPGDTSAHLDVLCAMNAALYDLELNARDIVRKFGEHVLPDLMSGWTTKTKGVKEQLVICGRLLFPFISHPWDDELLVKEWANDLIWRLWRRLDDDAENRGGLEPLTLESLRLDVNASMGVIDHPDQAAFIKHTWRAGYELTPAQVVTWSALELHADCLIKLHGDSEVSFAGNDGEPSNKRQKRDNPVKAFLSHLEPVPGQNDEASRTFRLQFLLFFIDRCWPSLHAELQTTIHQRLAAFLSDPSVSIQCWSMLCLAAIVMHQSSPEVDYRWDGVWSNAIRRVSIAPTCRAASHLVHCILIQKVVDPRTVVTDVENFGKELDVEGPAFPYDSVCALLVEFLRLAAQDVALHRLSLEDKALAWVSRAWNVVQGTAKRLNALAKVESHSPADLLRLFEGICQLRRRTLLETRILLPDCPTTVRLLQEYKTQTQRDFLLHATLPTYSPTPEPGMASREAPAERTSAVLTSPSRSAGHEELALPEARERRCSSFLLNGLENLLSEWSAVKDMQSTATAEMIRRSLDFIVLSLTWEASLTLNGTRFTRKVLQSASKLLDLLVPLIRLKRWSTINRALFLTGLGPLVSNRTHESDDFSDPMLRPNLKSGIRRKVLSSLQNSDESAKEQLWSSRTDIQRVVWRMSDVQDASASLLAGLRTICLHRLVSTADPIEVVDEDAWVIGQHAISDREALSDGLDDVSMIVSECASLCVQALTRIPSLRSAQAEGAQEQTFLKAVFRRPLHAPFLVLSGPIFTAIRDGVMEFSTSEAEKVLDLLDQNRGVYQYGRSQFFWLSALSFIDGCLSHYLRADTQMSEGFFDFAGRALSKVEDYNFRNTAPSAITVLRRYLERDRGELRWQWDECSARVLLDRHSIHADFRVRMMCAPHLARMFETAKDPLREYGDLYSRLPDDTARWEDMLARIVILANTMVPNSELRKAPYWALVLQAFQSPLYGDHIQAALLAVSRLLGMRGLSDLFMPYAGQLAYAAETYYESSGDDRCDLTRLSKLFGFKDRKSLARNCFSAMAPVFLTTASGPDVNVGFSYLALCAAKDQDAKQAMAECLPATIGLRIAFFINSQVSVDDLSAVLTDEQSNTLAESLTRTAAWCNVNSPDVAHLIRGYLVTIVVTILSLLIDADFASHNPVFQEVLASLPQILNKSGGASGQAIQSQVAVDVFLSLIKGTDRDFQMHRPILPGVNCLTILRSLLWVDSLCNAVFTKETVYHVNTQLLIKASRSSMVNEQMRCLHALILFLSLTRHCLDNASSLRSLLRGSSLLVSQIDVAGTSSNLLVFGFTLFQGLRQTDPAFPDIILRVGDAIEEFLSAGDPFVQDVGKRMRDVFEKQIRTLYEHPDLQLDVKTAIALWPSASSSFSFCDLSRGDIELILANEMVSHPKFGLVRQLRIMDPDEIQEALATSGFWRLKASMHSKSALNLEDSRAFSDLLAVHSNQIQAVEIETRPSLGAAIRFISTRENRTKGRGPPSPLFMVEMLLQLLSGPQTDDRAVAYVSLRKLVSFLSSDDDVQLKPLSATDRAEVRLLQFFPDVPYEPMPRVVEELISRPQVELSQDYAPWICFITSLLAEVHAEDGTGDHLIWAQIVPVLVSHATFAEQMLPVLVHSLLYAEALHNDMQHCRNRDALSRYFSEVLSYERSATATVRVIIDTVLYLRHHDSPPYEDPRSSETWLDLDYYLLSQRASSYGAYTTAFLFLELGRESHETEQEATAEDVMYSIYSHIDEPDGFYAIKTKDIRRSVIRSAEHEGKWSMALGFHGADSQVKLAGPVPPLAESSVGVVKSLQSLGFDNLAMSLLNTVAVPSASPELEYHLGWRTQTWDLPSVTPVASRPATALYTALRAVHRERRADRIDSAVRQSFLEALAGLRDACDDDMTTVKDVIRTVLCLRQICEWRDPEAQQQLRRHSLNFSTWSEFGVTNPDSDFAVLENVATTRISLLRAARHADEREQIGTISSAFSRTLKELETQCLLQLSKSARVAGNVQVALNAVTQAQYLDNQPSAAVSEEFSHVLWLQGERKLAVDSLQLLVNHQGKDSQSQGRLSASDQPELASLRAQLGSWMSEACLGEAIEINSRYFEPASESVLELFQKQGNIEIGHASVFYQYALFADAQYDNIGKRDLDRLALYIRRKEDELAWFTSQGYEEAERNIQTARQNGQEVNPKDKGVYSRHKRHRDRAIQILERDKARRDELLQTRDMFLRTALEMFSKALRFCDLHDEGAAIRLCSRWFSHFGDEQLNDQIADDLREVPSHKLVLLVHQLSARMQRGAGSQSASQRNLQDAMIRICRDHPFHSLYQVFALKGLQSRNAKTASVNDTLSQKGRADAAAFIFETLKQDRRYGKRATDVERVCRAYLEWADYPIKDKSQYKGQKGDFAIPSSQELSHLKSVAIPVTTADTPVDKTSQYKYIVYIASYDKKFTVAGGINMPKICKCYGSDGGIYKQLFKGEGGDDLRQDAVMEQVFGLVNHLLHGDLETRKRRLSIVTYKVFPLAAQAGLLEFVPNTRPLADWLSNAHDKYNKDWSVNQCTAALIPAKRPRPSPDQLRVNYLKICEHVRPVLRHFFTEQRKIPAAWFAMRLRYARSAATSSIVGHILGLGDRHASNILISQETGELVHIDHGIAFDQGQLLQIPETVPFRLTRDIVDGLGTCGTEGVFQRCAEHTLRVLREESDTIRTVLEVFRYDPLHSWTASPFQLAKAQRTEVIPPSTNGSVVGGEAPLAGSAKGDQLDMDSGIGEENADRALKSVADKLDKSMSVEYTVNQLISQAKDVSNLSRIFEGWRPWW